MQGIYSFYHSSSFQPFVFQPRNTREINPDIAVSDSLHLCLDLKGIFQIHMTSSVIIFELQGTAIRM